jgi:PadR family transcriptional regulator, regulatory protein AphA
MPSKSSTIFAILGLLSIKPMSAYELVKFSDETIGFFWNESYGNIYSKLNELAEAGDIQLVDEAQDGRRKKTYAITARGKQRLKDWLKTPTEEIIIRDELLLKLFIAEKQDLDQAKEMLGQEIRQMSQVLRAFEILQENIQSLDQDPVRKELWLLTLDYGMSYAQTRWDWCQAAHKKIITSERKS